MNYVFYIMQVDSFHEVIQFVQCFCIANFLFLQSFHEESSVLVNGTSATITVKFKPPKKSKLVDLAFLLDAVAACLGRPRGHFAVSGP